MCVSCSVMTDSLWPHGLQHNRLTVFHYLPESAQTHVHWVSGAIQPTHPLFFPSFSCPQFFPASGSFPMSWLFTLGAQSTGASTSAPIRPVNIQHWFALRLTGLISLQPKGLSRVFSTRVQRHLFFGPQTVLWFNPLEKSWFLLYEPLSAKWCLC